MPFDSRWTFSLYKSLAADWHAISSLAFQQLKRLGGNYWWFTADTIKIQITCIQGINKSIRCICSKILLTNLRIILIESRSKYHRFCFSCRCNFNFGRILVEVTIALSSHRVVNSMPPFGCSRSLWKLRLYLYPFGYSPFPLTWVYSLSG